MSTPLSIRFAPDVLDRLRRKAESTPGATPSGLAQTLVDEGLRMAEHPGIAFKDGPAGRRAALTHGPDVREVVTALREFDERGADAVDGVAELMALSADRIRVAMRYYAVYPAEIDREIAAAEAFSVAAEAAWRVEQHLLG